MMSAKGSRKLFLCYKWINSVECDFGTDKKKLSLSLNYISK